jgi:cyclomaltodextrin glucanotransferase
MRGRAERAGNRNYFGQERIDAASKHRASSPVIPRFAAWPAAQNERLKGDLAVFYRVNQKGGTNQTALVLLNKGNQTTRISVSDYLEPGEWRDAFTGGKRACGIAWRWTCRP